jgi:RNA polymerase sigma-70 factor (ECF subfamily)
VVYGDSGGTSPSWPRPIVGRDNVSRLILSLGQQIHQLGISLRRSEVNGQPGALFYDPDGRLINVFCLDIADGAVQTVRSVINPDRLHHLGPLSDVSSLRRQLRTTDT